MMDKLREQGINEGSDTEDKSPTKVSRIQDNHIENLKLDLERMLSESPDTRQRILRQASILKDVGVSNFAQLKDIEDASETETTDWIYH